MEEEVGIKYESGNQDDEIERLYIFMKQNLSNFEDQNLRQIAENLITDINKFTFNFSSNSEKFQNYGNKFVEIMKSCTKLDDAITHIDVYWIHKKIISNLMVDDDIETYEKYFYELIIDTTTESAVDEKISKCDVKNAGCLIQDVLTQEYLAARYVMSHLETFNLHGLNFIMNELKFKNVRNFMDSILKREIPVYQNLDGLVEAFNCLTLNLHNCITENQVFLIDFLLTNVLSKLESKLLIKVLNCKDNNNSNIFHLACAKRMKFLIEELWSLIQKAFDSDEKAIEKYLLQKNVNDKNAFMLAFQMPITYTNSDYANEIKNRTNILNYYRDPGPLELEMYNFESSLNLIYDIGRKHITQKCRKNLIISSKPKGDKNCDIYNYSKEFSDFRSDFLQLRFYCITKLSQINPTDMNKVNLIYQSFSGYIRQFMYNQCDNEEAIIALYQKLSFDTFLSDFFQVFLMNNFNQALATIQTAENLEKLIDISKKSLPLNDYHNLITKPGAGGNNALQTIILSRNLDMFRIIWSSFELNNKAISKWILAKNIDNVNSLYLMINCHQIDMLHVLLEYFSSTLDEDQIVYILQNTGKANYTLIDVAILFYDPKIFDLLIDFIRNHLSIFNQKTVFSKNIISLAVTKWQESALTKVLNLIESIMDENDIREFLFNKNWEGKTALHIASKNRNLTQLQLLSKFAHYYLTKDEFIELMRTKDNNEYSIIKSDHVSDEIIYNELPKISNFFSSYPVYGWVPIESLQFPGNALSIGSDNEGYELFIARIYLNNDNENNELKVIALSHNSQIDFEENLVDVLVGRGLMWCSRSNEHFSPIKIEKNGTFYIARVLNEVRLIEMKAEEEFEILCTDDINVLEIINSSDYIFTNVN